MQATRFQDRVLEEGQDIGGIMRTYSADGCVPVEVAEYVEARSKRTSQLSDVISGVV